MANRSLLKKYTTQHSRFLVIDGALVHYRDEGVGFPILLLHGAFSSLHTFNAWARELRRYYRVVRVDMQGFGLSEPREKIKRPVNEFLSFITRFLNSLGIYRCHIAGSSLGGWVSWEFSLRYPERVNKMILIDSAGYLSSNNVPLPFRMAQAPILGRVVKYAVQKNILERFVKQVYGDSTKVTDELVNRYYDLFTKKGNPEAFVNLVNGKYVDNTKNLKNILTPTLIMWGDKDRWLNVDNAYRFNEDIPNSKLIIYEEIGHLPMEEIPEESVNDALEFLLE